MTSSLSLPRSIVGRGRGQTRYLGRASLGRHADAEAREVRRCELKRGTRCSTKDGPDRWLVTVECRELYDRAVMIDQPQRRRIIFTREGALRIELYDVLQSAPFLSPDSLIQRRWGIFSLSVFWGFRRIPAMRIAPRRFAS